MQSQVEEQKQTAISGSPFELLLKTDLLSVVASFLSKPFILSTLRCINHFSYHCQIPLQVSRLSLNLQDSKLQQQLKYLSNFKNLQDFEIKTNKLLKTSQNVSEVFKQLSFFKNLHTLRLDGDLAKPQQVLPGVVALGIYKLRQSLRALVMKRVTLSSSFFSLQFTKLERIQLQACTLNEQGDTELEFAQNLNTFLINNPTITWLHVSGCKLAEVLSQIPALRTRQFQRIELSLNGITSASAVILKHINAAKLLHLNLSQNWIHHQGFLSLLPLFTAATSLSNLNISRNAFLNQPSPGQQQELIKLIESLTATSGLIKLKTLSLSGVFLDNWSVEHFVLPLIKKLALLKELDLSNNHIDEQLDLQLIDTLLLYGGEVINLNGNEFYDELSNLIVEKAYQVKRLRRLFLKACKQQKAPECLKTLQEGTYKDALVKKFKRAIPSGSRRIFLKREKAYLEVQI